MEYNREIPPQIHQAIERLRMAFDGTKVELLSTEMYRKPPSEFCPLGYLGVDILVEGQKVFLGCESMAEEIAWNPMGRLIAEDFVYRVLNIEKFINEKEGNNQVG
jgi:hypothetical protein